MSEDDERQEEPQPEPLYMLAISPRYPLVILEFTRQDQPEAEPIRISMTPGEAMVASEALRRGAGMINPMGLDA